MRAMQIQRLSGLSPLQRRVLLMVIDAGLLLLSVWLSFWLRLAQPWHPSFGEVGGWMAPASLVVGLPLFIFTGQYKGLTRYVGSRALYDLAWHTALLTLALSVLGSLAGWPLPPRSSCCCFGCFSRAPVVRCALPCVMCSWAGSGVRGEPATGW